MPDEEPRILRRLTKEEILDLDPEDFIKLKLYEISGTDLAILGMGAVLGIKGWTPLTFLINSASGLGRVLFDPQVTLPPVGPTGGISSFIANVLLGSASVTGPAAGHDIIGKAFIGAVEAYAITRPGFIGGVLQGIGEIVPL